MKKIPVGYVAKCQCGSTVGSIDLRQSGLEESGMVLGRWISSGYVLDPQFDPTWSVTLSSCKCIIDSESQ